MLPRRSSVHLYLAAIPKLVRLKERLPLLVFLLLSMAALPARAQYFRNSGYWKTHRAEYTIGLGISNFLGELGGRNQIGSPFVWDLELSQTKPAVSLGYRYHIAEKQALRLNLTYGILAGNDNLTTEVFRHNRNLSFKTDLFELAIGYEIHLYKEELGHVYDLRGVKGTKSSRMGLYLFVGGGGFYFNPKARVDNAWVELKPLGTEGQGLEGGAKEYSLLQPCLIGGVGLRKAFSKHWSVGAEVQYTKTFTDYIDDVSTRYYDPVALAANRGDLAAALANPALDEPEAGGPYATSTRAQRGDETDLDAYLFFKIQFHYKLYKYKTQGGHKYRTRIRRQKIVF
jgi:Outer membrane protein beta-barrel domain